MIFVNLAGSVGVRARSTQRSAIALPVYDAIALERIPPLLLFLPCFPFSVI
ncbi:MAG TPA: hypothetical protein V6D30_00930 [Leptolyngbyaceae cyanobacterium]